MDREGDKHPASVISSSETLLSLKATTNNIVMIMIIVETFEELQSCKLQLDFQPSFKESYNLQFGHV
ncbi:hypothetical protein L484_007650 [Morus notabilis]|uniref:Uncharacterized protein n=1 Tax=Morus notabilis TaxID=981085 RepID=W9RH43_9ROSA|nr:hypothetical protein L484_007650 [Morus notabilis]